MAQQSIEYGKRQGHNVLVYPWPVAASVVFKKKGGAFCSVDANGRLTISVGADTNVMGHAIFNEDFTASATAGATVVPLDMSEDSTYEIPINTGTWNDNMRGATHDLSVVAGIQGVDLTASTNKHIIVVDKGTTNAAGTVLSILCRLNVNGQIPRTT